MLEDWRFRESPYVERGGLIAYAGIPLRMQHESGESVGLGSLCVASATSQPPLSPSQQQTLTRLADWIVADIVQCARARRQRERRRLADLLATAASTDEASNFHEFMLNIMCKAYPGETVSIQPSGDDRCHVHGQDAIMLSDLENGLWEDNAHIDDIIATSNHKATTMDKVVRFMSAPCDSKLGHSLLIVATKDVRCIFDDVDAWFIQSCANLFTQNWQRCVITEAVHAKEMFLRGISHQLRTPLRGILGAAELLTEDLKLIAASDMDGLKTAVDMAGKASLYLDTISGAGRELMLTVNSIITLNRWTDVAATKRQYELYSTGQLESALLKRLPEATHDARGKPALFFHCDASLDSTKLRLDITLLGDCLLPLITNAIANTQESGVVIVAFSMCQASSTLVVDIEDTGCGIRPEDQQRIFNLYEKVTEHSTGAGLGLPLATKFAALLHGTIELVSSRINDGSHFRATFPNVALENAAWSPQITAPLYTHLPRNYCQLETESTGQQLSPHFVKFLTNRGFTNSEERAGDCFIIFDYNCDSNLLHRRSEAVAPGQVAICLVPKTVDAECLEHLPHLLYANEPFTTGKFFEILQEADKLAASLKESQKQLVKSDTFLASRNTSEEYFPSSAIKTSDLDGEYSASDESASNSSDSGPPHGLGSHSGSDTDFSPMCEPAERAVAAVSLTPFPTTRSPKPLVMVVDDNVVNLRILQMYCKKRCLPFISAADGQQAVDAFTRHQTIAAVGGHAPIELVLMDLQMPVCDGFDATRQIRALEQSNSWATSVVFMLTGQDSPRDRDAAYASGADDYMVKPIRMGCLDMELKRYFRALEFVK